MAHPTKILGGSLSIKPIPWLPMLIQSSTDHNWSKDAAHLLKPLHIKPPENFWGSKSLRTIQPSASGNQVPQHSDNFCQHQTTVQHCGSNHCACCSRLSATQL